MTWQKAPSARVCGCCRSAIKAGTPILLVTSLELVRCVTCAETVFQAEPPKDWPEAPAPPPVARDAQPFATPRGWAKRKQAIFDAKLAQAGELT